MSEGQMPDASGMSFSRMGACKCGMIKMTINGQQQCPKCDTKSKTRSGLVNKVKAAPKTAFKKVTRKGRDGKPYDDYVPKSKEEIAKEIQIGQVSVQPGSLIPPEASIDNEELNKMAVQRVAKSSVSPLDALDGISNYFENQPAKTMVEFKRLDKLRKAIKKLRTQVEEYIGGNK